MGNLAKKIAQLVDLLKAIKAPSAQKAPKAPSLPQLPKIKQPIQPSMTPSKASTSKIGPGVGPDSKKDPKKVAQQIKDGSMSTKTQKVMFKSDTGQWYLEDED